MTDPSYPEVIGELTRFKQIVLDLDRCQHGRHAADPCFGCPDGNHGNPLLPPGTLIGTSLHGRIVVPPNEQRYDPKAWIVPDSEELQDVARSAAHAQSLMRLGAAAYAYHTLPVTEMHDDAVQTADLYRAIEEHRRQFPEQR